MKGHQPAVWPQEEFNGTLWDLAKTKSSFPWFLKFFQSLNPNINVMYLRKPFQSSYSVYQIKQSPLSPVNENLEKTVSMDLITLSSNGSNHTAPGLCPTHTGLPTVLQSPRAFAQAASSTQNCLSPQHLHLAKSLPSLNLVTTFVLVFSVSRASVSPLVSITANWEQLQLLFVHYMWLYLSVVGIQ